MRGRKPESLTQRMLNGSATVAEMPRDPVTFTAPEFLSDDARVEWDRVIPELEKLGYLAHVDRMLLAAYCQTYANWKLAEETTRKEGQTFRTSRGDIRAHPAAKLALSCLTELRRIAAEFGFTPTARTRIPSPGNDPQSKELDEFLN